jgi:3-deoxy-D-manno-octulosonic-acid transferase
MMEPCALGKPVVVGPATVDFTETVEKLVEGDGLIVTDTAELRDVLHQLFGSPERRAALGEKARSVVASQQGATTRTRLILESLVQKRPGDGDASDA